MLDLLLCGSLTHIDDHRPRAHAPCPYLLCPWIMAFPSDQSGFTNSYRRMPNKSDTQARAPYGAGTVGGEDADAIDIFPLGEITCVGRFGGLILPAHSDFKVCYLSLRSSGNCLHLPVFPAKIPQSRDIDANKPDFRGWTPGSHSGI